MWIWPPFAGESTSRGETICRAAPARYTEDLEERLIPLIEIKDEPGVMERLRAFRAQLP